MKQEATIKVWIPDNNKYTVADILSGLKKWKIKTEVTSVFNILKLPNHKTPSRIKGLAKRVD